MKAAVRLGLYGLILVAVFAAAWLIASAVVSEETVENWLDQAPEHSEVHEGDGHG